MKHVTGTYEVKRLAKMGAQAVWLVRGNGVDRKVTIGENMPAVTALTRALEEDLEDLAWREQQRAHRMAGG